MQDFLALLETVLRIFEISQSPQTFLVLVGLSFARLGNRAVQIAARNRSVHRRRRASPVYKIAARKLSVYSGSDVSRLSARLVARFGIDYEIVRRRFYNRLAARRARVDCASLNG